MSEKEIAIAVEAVLAMPFTNVAEYVLDRFAHWLNVHNGVQFTADLLVVTCADANNQWILLDNAGGSCSPLLKGLIIIIQKVNFHQF